MVYSSKTFIRRVLFATEVQIISGASGALCLKYIQTPVLFFLNRGDVFEIFSGIPAV